MTEIADASTTLKLYQTIQSQTQEGSNSYRRSLQIFSLNMHKKIDVSAKNVGCIPYSMVEQRRRFGETYCVHLDGL
jgi:hypothetical protein